MGCCFTRLSPLFFICVYSLIISKNRGIEHNIPLESLKYANKSQLFVVFTCIFV